MDKLLTINERRAELGYEPIPSGDRIMLIPNDPTNDELRRFQSFNDRRARLGFDPVPLADFMLAIQKYKAVHRSPVNQEIVETLDAVQNARERDLLQAQVKELEGIVAEQKKSHYRVIKERTLLEEENNRLNKENEELLDRVEELQALLESLNSLGNAPRRNGQRGID